MKKKFICSYCGGEGKSKEHIFPSWLLRETREYELKKDSLKGTVGPNENTVIDVCPSCNNGPLSKLDTYCHELYKSFWSKVVRDKILFTYDFFKLTRWLLKVSFNAARHQKTDAGSFKPYIRYMLGDDAGPPDRVLFFVEVIKPSLAIMDGEKVDVEPHDHRVGTMPLGKNAPFDVVQEARFVAINSFYFYIIFLKDSPSEAIIEAIKANLPQQWVRLAPENESVEVHPMRHYLEVKSVEVERNRDLYTKGLQRHSGERKGK